MLTWDDMPGCSEEEGRCCELIGELEGQCDKCKLEECVVY